MGASESSLVAVGVVVRGMTFLESLLELLRQDGDGRGPGARVTCKRCGTVRVIQFSASLINDDHIALNAVCPHCGSKVREVFHLG